MIAGRVTPSPLTPGTHREMPPAPLWAAGTSSVSTIRQGCRSQTRHGACARCGLRWWVVPNKQRCSPLQSQQCWSIVYRHTELCAHTLTSPACGQLTPSQQP